MATRIQAAAQRGECRSPVKAITLGLVVVGVVSVLVELSPAGAAGVEPARVKVVTALLDETVKGLLPLALSLPAPTGPAVDGGIAAAPAVVPATLTALRYCGPTPQGAGKFRAALRLSGIPAGASGSAAPESPVTFMGEGDCRASLGDLGKRLAGQLTRDDAALVVADLEASWHAWEVRVTVARFVVAGEPRGAGVVGWGEGRREVMAFSTAGLVVPTGMGPLVFHASPAFATDGIEIAATLGEPGSSPPLSPPAASATPAIATASDAAANATFEVPYALGNQLLRAFTARPVPLRVGRETVDVQNASLRGAAGNVTITALASPRAVPEAARVNVAASGEDLRIGAVRADAQLESCSGLGMLASVACSARNAARNAAAAALGASATDRYRSQLVRELAGAQELHLTFGRRELKMTGELVRIAATARGLLVGARLTPGDSAAASVRMAP